MRSLRLALFVIVVALAANGCVARGPATASAANSTSLRAERAGLASSAEGDNWMAANQFEQAREGYDSPLNRFNLAAAYEATGRPAEAAALYRTVLVDGRSATVVVNQSAPDAGRAGRKVNVAAEARRRLAAIDARMGKLAPPNFVPGASASAFVGGPSSGRVTDADALRLDDAARTANDE